MSRRSFVKIAGMATLGVSFTGFAPFRAQGVSIVVDPTDTMAGSDPVKWAIREFTASLESKGISVHRSNVPAEAPGEDLAVVVAGWETDLARQLLDQGATEIPNAPEALALVPAGRRILLASGSDARGLTYALSELSDRVQLADTNDSPLSTLELASAVVERPANVVRSNQRLFVSDVEDKPWFNDREMWPHYLTMLASNRFNRFNLSFGIGFDFLQNVEDAYFLFPYPFFVSVPGFDVRVPQLPDAERESNLEMLRYISDLTVERGMEFQLGIWMHGYEWLNSPSANYTIEGLTPDIHGQYCGEAIRLILQECPSITGVTFRIHGEGGVPEGNYGFWETVFNGAATSGREVMIDMHTKGMDQVMLDTALATGMPISTTPKYWGEHIGLPYHQTDIRAHEYPDFGFQPRRDPPDLMSLSEGARSFMRYGYGDLLSEDRPWVVTHRIWPGTQRLLLWGDPVTAGAHARAFSFSGSTGAEWMEPLSFKGRRGSGQPGDRCGYSDESLMTRWDWEKYLYTYRIFGRHLYNPEVDPAVWHRALRKDFGPAAEAVAQALAHATRILPTLVTAHAPSGGNNHYWPEMKTNQPIVREGNAGSHYYERDVRSFVDVSPLDPQIFLRITEHTQETLMGRRSGKYTPIQVAQWLEDFASAADRYLEEARTRVPDTRTREFRRMEIDVSMQIGLGRFFGRKLRSGVLYSIYEETGERAALEQALAAYRHARTNWAEVAEIAQSVYRHDIGVGHTHFQQGHWLDRLPAIDLDIEDMEAELAQTTEPANAESNSRVQAAIREALARPEPTRPDCEHEPPADFEPGDPIDIGLSYATRPVAARLFYRHVNHGERWQSVDMWVRDNSYQATIPSAYTNATYPLQYYFQLEYGPDSAAIYPGLDLDADLTGQPYFLLRRAEANTSAA